MTNSGVAAQRSIDANLPSRVDAASTDCNVAIAPERLPAPARLVAVGDLHGDLAATRQVLELAGVLREGKWSGGQTVLVQTGDVLDRGDDEREIYELLFALVEQAEVAGGKVILLNGNHELMNAVLDFRYVTNGGYEDWRDVNVEASPELAEVPELARGRALAFSPGGVWARKLAELRTAVIVGDSVFVHGGITPRFSSDGIAAINRETQCFLSGAGPPPDAMTDPEGPLWSRRYSAGPPPCEELKGVLSQLGVRRMVVGHTPQLRGITSACDGAVWRIDVGLAKYYGGPTQALEVTGDSVRVLK